MRFEVRYSTGTAHEVELQGTLAILGRDPTCDLVLNDPKCSRRHAVIEAGPEGLSIRDAGSANGVYVNDKRVERASLVDGDEIRLGGAVIKVLPEDMPGTLVMGPDEIVEVQQGLERATVLPPQQTVVPPPAVPALVAPPPRPPQPLPRPAPSIPRPAPSRLQPPRPPASPVSAPPRDREPRGADLLGPEEPPRGPYRPGGPTDTDGPLPRPLTGAVLAALWLLTSFSSLVGVFVLLWLGRPILALAAVGTIGIGLALGIGLLGRQPWARVLQILVAILGLPTCVLTPVAAVVLAYMLRPATRIHYSGRRTYRELDDTEADLVRTGASEGLFTTGVLLGLVVALAIIGVVTAFVLPHYLQKTADQPEAVLAAQERIAVEKLRMVATAETRFREGTCNLGYADMEGLIRPASVIPNYRPDGPSFLGGPVADDEAYAYALDLGDAVPPTEGCPTRSFRTFAFSASPLRGGRHLVVGPEGAVHVAQGRRATLDDPAYQ